MSRLRVRMTSSLALVGSFNFLFQIEKKNDDNNDNDDNNNEKCRTAMMTTEEEGSSSGGGGGGIVIITGGGGFLGQCLATSLLKKGTIRSSSADGKDDVKITKLILADISFPTILQPIIENYIADNIVIKKQGDISDLSYCQSLYDEVDTSSHSAVSIFHLGAVMSGDGERDFDLCMNVNLYGFINMINCAKELKISNNNNSNSSILPKFIFTSAGATLGSGSDTDYIDKDDVINDSCRATPHTTYGMTKACCELLLSDYSRRKFIDGRGIRLPTIVVRAGKPNAATTGCFSSIIREPLSSIDVDMPIGKDVLHAVTGYKSAIDAMITLHDTSLSKIESILGYDRTIFLPAIATSLCTLHETLLSIVKKSCHGKLGNVSYDNVNDNLSNIVGSFPTKVDAYRAIQLGIPDAPTPIELIKDYIKDFKDFINDDIEFNIKINDDDDDDGNNDNESTTKEDTEIVKTVTKKKVAVITGGGSGIGQAVAQRLSKGGWIVVLVGRTMSKLQETKNMLLVEEEQQKLEGGGTDDETDCCLCIQADVSNEKDVNRLFNTVEYTYGRIDVLFNNAGINVSSNNVENVPLDDFDNVMKVNVTGPFLCARGAMKLMKKQKVGGGRIINNGSISAHTPRPGSVCYTTSKHAVLGLTKCIALDGRSINVACGQVDFGNVVSKMSLATNKVTDGGALQPNGTKVIEPSMTLSDAAETIWTMVNLPLEANILQMTVMATNMPFVGRG